MSFPSINHGDFSVLQLLPINNQQPRDKVRQGNFGYLPFELVKIIYSDQTLNGEDCFFQFGMITQVCKNFFNFFHWTKNPLFFDHIKVNPSQIQRGIEKKCEDSALFLINKTQSHHKKSLDLAIEHDCPKVTTRLLKKPKFRQFNGMYALNCAIKKQKLGAALSLLKSRQVLIVPLISKLKLLDDFWSRENVVLNAIALGALAVGALLLMMMKAKGAILIFTGVFLGTWGLGVLSATFIVIFGVSLMHLYSLAKAITLIAYHRLFTQKTMVPNQT